MCVTTLDAHVGGAAVRLVTSGLPAIDGASMSQRRLSFEQVAGDVCLRLTREPRGHAGLVGVVFTEGDRADADAGLLFFTGAGTRSLSGHAAMAASALALNHGLITPRTTDVLRLDTEPGPVMVRVASRDARQRVRAVRFEGPPAAVLRGNVRVTTSLRPVRVDVAWSGSEVVAIVEGEAAGVPLSSSHALELRRTALDLITTLDAMLTLTPPGCSDAAPISACALVGPASDLRSDVRSVMVRSDGSVSRSPSASGTAAVSVVLAAMGVLAPGAVCRHESLSGTSWTAEATPCAHDPAALTDVAITAEVHATGSHEFVLEPEDQMTCGVQWL
jgi:proline racemase